MKILLVTLSNRGGGAARAVDSLAKALLNARHEVRVLTYEGSKSDYPITILGQSRQSMLAFRLKNQLAGWIMRLSPNPSHDYRSINMIPSKKLLREINDSDAEIVNFHWYGAEMLRIEQIVQIKKPIVWTLHDAWMVNGVYHVSPLDYRPFLCNSGDNWLDRFVFKRKKKTYAKVPMHFISPSQWIADRFYGGSLYKDGDSCVVIRNLMDTTVWKAMDKLEAKKELGFVSGKTHVLFIANNILTSFNKGFVFVKQLLAMCDDTYEFHFVGNSQMMEINKVKLHGRIKGQEQLVIYYSASDICLIPSLSENMPYVALESLYCNTPVLCFDNTGFKELIRNGLNGYKAKNFDVDDLYSGLEYLKGFKPERPVCESIPDFDSELNIRRYVEEYERVINLKKQ